MHVSVPFAPNQQHVDEAQQSIQRAIDEYIQGNTQEESSISSIANSIMYAQIMCETLDKAKKTLQQNVLKKMREVLPMADKTPDAERYETYLKNKIMERDDIKAACEWVRFKQGDVGDFHEWKESHRMLRSVCEYVKTSAGIHSFDVVATAVLDSLESALRPEMRKWFLEPVDASAPHVADYYHVVPHGPVSLNTIRKKIANPGYGPKDLYDDIMKLCDNSYEYNIKAHPDPGLSVGKAGLEMERQFLLKVWPETPYTTVCPPRSPRRLVRIDGLDLPKKARKRKTAVVSPVQ